MTRAEWNQHLADAWRRVVKTQALLRFLFDVSHVDTSAAEELLNDATRLEDGLFQMIKWGLDTEPCARPSCPTRPTTATDEQE